MAITSAGILLYRRSNELEIFAGHMGGPFWAKKTEQSWSIPKGLYTEEEEPLAAALREFTEEIGTEPPAANYSLLGEYRQASGKRLTVFAAESDFEAHEINSNTFELEWPPRSGKLQQFPELDQARWLTLDDARVKLVKGQLAMLDDVSTR